MRAGTGMMLGNLPVHLSQEPPPKKKGKQPFPTERGLDLPMAGQGEHPGVLDVIVEVIEVCSPVT